MVTVTVALAAAAVAIAAARYRLPVELVHAVTIFSVFAGTVPAWVGGAFGRAWPAAICLCSGAVMLAAAGWAVRTRSAQLLPGWSRLLHREVEAEAAAEDED